MPPYVWQHGLDGERERLRLMSDILDPSSRFHLKRVGVTAGWRCIEIGAGNGSLSQWLAERVGPTGHVTATDIHTDLMDGIARPTWRSASSMSSTTRRRLRRMTSLRSARCCIICPNAARW
jgi:2-polyprenyl-3-methyl-5-hydroxy-6-metoxy-1,4-benzoquinol methylase